jgi:hypothetical protein
MGTGGTTAVVPATGGSTGSGAGGGAFGGTSGAKATAAASGGSCAIGMTSRGFPAGSLVAMLGALLLVLDRRRRRTGMR